MSFRVFCIFPHPDDESFLIGGTIASMTASGAEVSLYTLTRGERSRHAARLGISPEALATLRSTEVREAARILGISSFSQGDYPDGGLRDLDPRIIERDIHDRIQSIRPHLLITFDVQGSSVHPDHIVMHHIVKRVFVDLQESLSTLQRLAFCVLPSTRTAAWPRKVFGVPDERIHARIPVAEFHDVEYAAIHTHVSVLGDVQDHNYDNWMLWEEECFTLFDECLDHPMDSLLQDLVDLD